MKVFFSLAAALVLLAVVPQFASRTLPDTAWLLYAAGRVLDGATLYVDLVEVNPPLIVWLNLIPVGVARPLDASPVTVYRILVLALTLASVTVCARLIGRGLAPAPVELRRLLVLLILFGTLTLAREDYGEREHLLLALVMPYVLLAWLRAEEISIDWRAAAGIGLAAGMGIALKPYFGLLWLALELYLWLAGRRRSWLRPESLAVVGFGLVYLASVLYWTPQYLQIARMMAGPYYEFLSNSLWYTALLGDGAQVALLVVFAYAALYRQSRHPRLWAALLAATVGLYLSGVLQHKGWRYHFYPSMATGVLLLGLMAVDLRRPLRSAISRAYAAAAAAFAAGFPLWIAFGSIQQALDPKNPRYDADPDIGRLIPLVRAESHGDKVMMLSWSMASTFPLLTYAGVESASRFNSLWILGAVYRNQLRSAEPLRYREPAAMSPLERYLNSAVTEDLRRNRPALVLALRAAPDLPQWGLRRLDHLGYFSRDSSFARLFADYGFMAEVGQYAVYRRLRPGEPPRPAPVPRPGRDLPALLPKESKPVEADVVFAAIVFAAIFVIALVFGATGKVGCVKVVILAGGMGSRLQEQTTVRPKPMVEIGGRPILWHIMKAYAAHGFQEFVLALGYKAEMVQEYFINYHRLGRSVTVDLSDGSAVFHDKASDDWRVHLVNTGLNTETGGRLRRLREWVNDGPFLMTYGDGVANLDIRDLVAFHQAHGKLATITAVRPPSRFGGLRLEGERVAEFQEKPQIGEGWINGGFFVLSSAVLDLIPDDGTLWEHGPLEHLSSTGDLMAYRHTGFWHPMDTLRDVNYLERLWASGEAPWKIWP